MWRWTVFLYLLIFYGHTSSQPVADDSENTRQARQLDFGECCPCPGAGQAEHDFGARESSTPASGRSFARARDLDDCPCRPQHSDSEGTSSIFFPTSMRSGGPVMRPVEKKDDPKPLLHPEVDLASSVLQTLREATDEEYQNALARDAARSIAKAAEETVFEDATPEASTGNIVTIIVNPKKTNSFDDIMPQESHVQESRCIQAPLESVRTNLGNMRVAPKPPSLLREMFGLPRTSNLLDMDNGVAANNIQKPVIHVDDEQVTNKGIQGLKKYAPLMKLNSNIKSESPNIKSNVDVERSVNKVPDFKSFNGKEKVKDLISRSSSLGIGKTSSLPLIPKITFNNFLPKTRPINNEDLSLSPSNIQEQSAKNLISSRPSLGIGKTSSLSLIPKMRFNHSLSNARAKNNEDLSSSPSIIQAAEKMSFFRTKSHLQNIFEKTRPVTLKKLLKLKDVEFIPLKDIGHKAADRLNFVLPSIINRKYDVISTNKDKNRTEETFTTEKILTTSKIEVFDHEISPSNVFEQISDDNCNNGAIKKTETGVQDAEKKLFSTEVIDTVPSPSNIRSTVIDRSTDFGNSQSDELTDNIDDCEIKTLPVTQKNPSQSTDRSSDAEIQDSYESELNSESNKSLTPDNTEEQQNRESQNVLNEEHCVNNSTDADSITDSSNLNYIFETKDTVPEKSEDLLVRDNIPIPTCSQEQQRSGNLKAIDSNPENKLIKPLSLHKTLSSLKENMIKKLENLNTHRTSPRNLNIFDHETPNNNIENKETSTIINENQDTDCPNEETIQITTVKPEICNDDLEDRNDSSEKISMQDLQKISDSMLLQEEKERESKKMQCIEPSKEVTELKIPSELSNKQTGRIDSEQSANSQNEVVMDPQNSVDFGGKNEINEGNTCLNDLILPKQSLVQQSDANSEASEVVISRIPQSKDIISSPLFFNKVIETRENDLCLLNNPLPDLKLAPLPTFEEIKLRLTGLFDKNVRDVEQFSTSEADSMIDKINILKPSMATDASTTSFRTRSPPFRLEDVNLDILQLKPQSSLASIIPKIDLHSYNINLPMPKDLRFKPIKLQSTLEDKGGMLGATSIGRNKITRVFDNPWETLPNLDDFKTRIQTNTQKILNPPFKPDNLINNVISSQGISDLSDNIHSHAKNTLRNMQRTLESTFREAPKKPLKLQSHDLIEVISRNHEDVNDKLRAIHIDFNDRMETMRNNLFDKSRLGTSESRNRKLQTGQPKLVTNRRESKKTLTPRRLEKQRQTGIGTSQRLANQKYKMPAAASLLVPSTIEVPELKNALTKSPGLGIQRTLGDNPNIRNVEIPQAKESSVALWKQRSKKLPNINTPLGKQINPFKDSKIKVSFSTTPRPTIGTSFQSRKLETNSPHLQNANSRKIQGRFGPREDHNGAPSEINNSITTPSISSHLNQHNFVNSAMDSERKQAGRSFDEVRPPRKLIMKLRREGNPEIDPQSRKSNDLHSWPKVTESAFLSKVKEAVKASMSKINSPVTLKQSNVLSDAEKSSLAENEGLNWMTDMTRSASENTDIIEGQGLKENVSYKCTMICTKE